MQDFIPYRAKKEVNININTKSENNKHEINNKHIDINNSNYDDNINNLKLKLNIGEKPMKKNNSNINIIKNNNNEKYSSNLIFNKFGNERKKNFFYNNNEYYKTPKKFDSMGSIPPEKNSFFSPTSVNSYNIIINNKIVPIKNKSNNINLINKKENINTQPEMNNKNIFTMAGRTTKEQQEVINISSKLNISKPKSLCSYDFNSKGSKMDNKNKFHRLNQKEKLEILHKINQRNKNPKSLSTNNKALEKIRSINPVSPNNNNIYNSDISLEERNKKRYDPSTGDELPLITRDDIEKESTIDKTLDPVLYEDEIYHKYDIETLKQLKDGQLEKLDSQYLVICDKKGYIKILNLKGIFGKYRSELAHPENYNVIGSNFNLLKKDDTNAESFLAHLIHKSSEQQRNFYNQLYHNVYANNIIRREWRGHLDAINSVEFIEDPKSIVTVSNDMYMRVWDERFELIGEINIFPNETNNRYLKNNYFNKNS